MNNYYTWIEKTKNNSVIYDELISIENSKEEINDRFYRELTFGTGGLRGIIGAGTNRMNIYTVGRASCGLANYMIKSDVKKSVVIAYDSRNMSREFAERSAQIFSSKGISVYLFDKLTPTPVLSFAVRELGAGAGIVITASHNPKEYNGYKVYNSNGCQITDNDAKQVYDEIEKVGYFEDYQEKRDLINVIGDEILNKYLNTIIKYVTFDKISTYAPKIVYTPLNGTGNIPVRKVLSMLGVNDVKIVEEQELPDGNFTTCPYPNPEERATLKLALEKGNKENAELILATDPDADRIGIAVRDNDGNFTLLNGNETGILLMDYMLSIKKEQGTLGQNPTVVKTIVSTDMAFDIGKKYGANIVEVLTGFKYIGETIDTTDNYVMGFEESYGYLVGTFARDKDAVSAVMLITEMYAYYKSKGISLYEKLISLYEEHGYYITALKSITYNGANGAEKMKSIIDSIRKSPITHINGKEIVFTDFQLGVNNLPKSDVLRFKTDDVRIVIRPSGTEPKLKIYYQVKSNSINSANDTLQLVAQDFEKILQ